MIPQVDSVPMLVEQMHIPDPRGRFRPMLMFIRFWNDHPDRRTEMLADPPYDGEHFYVTLAAATVHALCQRDGMPVPEWVWNYRLDEDRFMTGDRVSTSADTSESPLLCYYHRVHFKAFNLYE